MVMIVMKQLRSSIIYIALIMAMFVVRQSPALAIGGCRDPICGGHEHVSIHSFSKSGSAACADLNWCSQHGSCIRSTCTCDAGWSGKDCATLAECPENCNSPNGWCQAGTCVCQSGFGGVTCAEDGGPGGWQSPTFGASNEVEARSRVQMLAQPFLVQNQESVRKVVAAGVQQSKLPPDEIPGAYDRSNLNSGDTDVIARTKLVPLIVGACEDDCSGHGKCLKTQCICFDGWTGETCGEQLCKENCSGHGTCLFGTCACDEAFYGSACENRRCLNDCSGHGFCNNGVCKCFGHRRGPICDELVPVQMASPLSPDVFVNDSFDAEAEHDDPPQDFLSRCKHNCNLKGKCNADGTCDCFRGYSGHTCEDFCPNQCSGHGECTDGMCLCFAGYVGDDCSNATCCSGHGDCSTPGTCVCHAGFMGDLCDVEKQCPMCSSHGTCSLGVCECLPDWHGETCDEAPKECRKCPAHGRCDRMAGICMCGPLPCFAEDENVHESEVFSLFPKLSCGNQGMWSDELARCVCTGLWYGDSCEKLHCEDWHEDAHQPECAGHGTCIHGTCFCEPGWGQAPNSTETNVCAEWLCPTDCLGHGVCNGSACVCHDGWKGPACQEPKCLNDCSGHGNCTFDLAKSSAECVCQYGFSPPDCVSPAVYREISPCPNECSGRGLCLDGNCLCSESNLGSDCSQVGSVFTDDPGLGLLVAACPRDCGGNGLCLNGKCLCRSDYTGEDCSLPLICHDTCGEVCFMDPSGERCESCKGQCTMFANASVQVGA